MDKINPFALDRPPRKEWTIALSDPSQPGLLLAMNLTELNVIEQLAALEKAEALTRKYVTGQGRAGEEGYQAPLPFPPVGGKSVEGLSERVFEAACLIERAQIGPAEDRYTAQEVVALMVNPGFAQGLLEAARKAEGGSDPYGAPQDQEGG